MPMPFQVESIDAVPEAQRSLYKETNGKFVLDVDGYEDPTNLKSALQKEREAAKTATKQAQAWAALGKTPDEIQALEQQTKEREQLESKLKAKDSAIERHLVDAQATAAIAAAKGVPALLLPHVKASVRVVEDGGEYVVRVVDAAGNPRVDAKGEFLSIADLVGEMRQSEIFGRAFEPTGTTGSGAQGGGSGGTGKVMKQSAIDAMKPAERAKFFASGGIAVA
jgi:hypothetical protein